nr:Ig-like domain-containing protein [Bacteroidota bacterium]
MYEPYGAYGEFRCRVDSGEIIITDNLSDLEQDSVMFISDSATLYAIQAGYPNIYSGGQHSHQKVIQVKFDNDNGSDPVDEEWVYITGQQPRATAFATTTPDIPLLILRDPPGDLSYSKMTNEYEYSQAFSFGVEKTGSIGAFPKTTTCVKFNLKFLFGIKLKLVAKTEFTSGIDLTVSQNSITENTMTFNVSETFQTDGGGNVVGPGADLYMGGAMNLLYGITDILSISGDTVSVDQDIIIAPNGFATTYIYTEYHILNTVIPNLYLIQDTVSALRWESFIALNDSLKLEAIGPVDSKTFGSGVEYSLDRSATLSRSHTETFDVTVDANVAYESSLKIKNVEAGGGVKISASLSAGKSETTTSTYTKTVGYFLKDEDAGDSFAVDIATDPVYGTPVFTTISGFSSCPHEEMTVPRQGCELSQPLPMWDVPADEAAHFLLDMTNTSENNDAFFYGLRLLNETNNNGAIVKANSLQLGLAPIYFELQPNSTLTIPVDISRPSGQIYDFEGITLRLASECEAAIGSNLGVVPNLSDDATFDVHFAPPCSPISIDSLDNNWVVNQDSNNILPVTITDYELINPDLHSVGLEYEYGNYWIEIFSIPKDEIQSLSLDVDLDVSSLLDGPHKLRAVVECEGNVLNYTGVKNGVIDRTAPLVSSTPLPSDGILNFGDEISFTFNEKLDPSSVTINNCRLLDADSGKLVASTVQYSQSLNKVIFTINPGNANFIENRSLIAQIAGITDRYGNMLADTAIWPFYVDQGPLRWNPDSFVFTINDGDSIDFSSSLTNITSNDQFYWLTLPEWLTALPDTGTLSGSGGSMSIDFSSGTLQGGIYYDTIIVNSLAGYPPEELYITIQTAGGPELAVNPANQSVLAASGSCTFNISSNTTWAITENADWFSIDPMSGEGNAGITVTYNENTLDIMRNGEITVTALGDLLPVMVTLTQNVWPFQIVSLPAGWSGLSSYVMPEDVTIENVYGDILDKLVIAITEDGIFYPAYNVNTIFNWEQHSAYKVKTNTAVDLNINGGELEEDLTLQLHDGWNLIPVVSACPVDVETLFAPVVNDIVIVKDVAGYGVYWPALGINSLGTLNPGEAYYVLMDNAAAVTFGDCNKSATLNLTGVQNLSGLVPWQLSRPTGSTHSFDILFSAIKDFEQGSIIGAFDQAGNCWGAMICGNEASCLSTFGDDTY